MDSEYKYYAFISYSSKDIRWGKKLHRKLTQFKLPSILCSDNVKSRKPIRPVFFAPYNIQPGELPDELKRRLEASKYLLVVSSPNSAQSEWVSKEIKYFCSINKKENVYFFIINGEPGSSDKECYNPIIKETGFVNPLGVNINEKIYSFPFNHWNRERAYVQLITKLLGIDFDVLWNHHKRYLIQKVSTIFVGILLLIGLITSIILYYKNIEITLSIKEQTANNKSLPAISNINLKLSIDSYNNNLIISNIDSNIVIKDIPRRFIGKTIKVKLFGDNCLNSDTTFCLKKKNQLLLYRDTIYYGQIRFTLREKYTHETIPNATIHIDEFETKSNDNGYVDYNIPISKQRKEYIIRSDDLIFEDSIIQPPFCSDNRVIIAKKINIKE